MTVSLSSVLQKDHHLMWAATRDEKTRHAKARKKERARGRQRERKKSEREKETACKGW